MLPFSALEVCGASAGFVSGPRPTSLSSLARHGPSRHRILPTGTTARLRPIFPAMSTIYWAALVLGAGLALLSLAGDIFGGDADVGADADGIDTDHDLGAFRIVTMRNLTYFMMGFGAVGVLLGWLQSDRSPVLTAAIAAATGLLCATMSALAFGYLRRSASGDLPDDRSLVGLVGNVVLPLAHGSGKILVQRAGREIELLARPLDDAADDSETWTSVLVVEVREGIAYVAPYRDLLEE